MSRRGFLAAAGAAAAAGTAGAATPTRPRAIVDVHSHFLSPSYIREMRGDGLVSDVMMKWTLPGLLEDMDRSGVARSILSVTTPSIPYPGARGRSIAREVNEYGAKIVSDHRPKLGLFADLPMTDMEGALAEAAYALDTLKANGIGLLTSYGDKWLGDRIFDPLFEELNRRHATVFVHPTAAPCCMHTVPLIRTSVIEYGTDTTRAITNYVYSGAARRYPNVKMIFSHAGGTMPFLIERFDVTDKDTPAVHAGAPDGYRAEIRKFFYDTAQASNRVAMGALRQVVPLERILFGTDYPYRTFAEHTGQLERDKVFTPAELGALYRGNVARQLPGLLA